MLAVNRSPHIMSIPGYVRVTVQPQEQKRWSFFFVDCSSFYLFFVPHPLLSPPIFKSCSWLFLSSCELFLVALMCLISSSLPLFVSQCCLSKLSGLSAGGQAHATSLIHWRSGVSCLCVCIMSHNIDGLEGSCCGKGLSRCAIFLIYFCLFPPLPIPPFLSQMPVHYGCDLGCSMPCLFIMGPHPTFFTLLNATFLSRVDNH